MSNNDSEATKRTVVEEGTHFKGDLTSSCPIDVRGRVEGEIQAPSLTVSANGAVHGRAKVGAVRSEGELSGEFEAETIELSGTVKDQTVIRARSIEVRLSSTRGQQVLFGDCELSVGDEPSEHDIVEEPEAVQPAALEEPQPVAAMATAEPPEAEHAEASNELADESADAAEAAEARASDATSEQEELPSNLEEALSSEAEANGKKRMSEQAQADQNGTEVTSGWSQPPSQPPPAN
jgi:cytoskeletal protein CcmA (bactofilin family)